jgi:hypothetical protein
MNEGEFWNNLDSFVDKKGTTGGATNSNPTEHEKVDDWLKKIPDPNEKTQKNDGNKSKSPIK